MSGFTLLELLIVLAVIGILSAIAIPVLLPSRIAANEAAALEDLRDAVPRQSGNPFEIVGAPITCPTPPSSFATTRSGYVRGCTAGVYWATPVAQGKTGVRGFGTDGSGRICYTPDGSIPSMSPACNALR